MLICFRRSSITSSSVASLTSRIRSMPQASTSWNSRRRVLIASCRSVSGKASPSMLSGCCAIELPQPAAGFLLALSRLLSAISAQPQIVSVSGCPAELIPLLERSCFFQKGTEYPFRFDALSLPSMMHERWGSVFGSISFFSQLKFLITFLDGCGGQPWAALMPEFVRVRSMSHRL